jgi:AcrR family transcriptional regulator
MSPKSKAVESLENAPQAIAEQAGKERAGDRIFKAACELFYRQGIRGVGVETIAEQAHATKMSLYRAYPSKDELVAEYLRCMSRLFFQVWDELLARHPGDPRRQLEGLFAELNGRINAPESRGCAIANASVELTDPDHPGRRIIAEHKAKVRESLLQLCSQLPVRDPAALADGLFLLMEGALACCQTLGPCGPGNAVMLAGNALLESHLKHAAAG